MSTQVTHKLNWNGPALRGQVVEAIVGGVQEFGLTHETKAKSKLRKGRGVLTGTLRRSIHAGALDYNYAEDEYPPSNQTPEQGGQMPDVAERDGVVGVAVGSGQPYARKIEALYAYMAESHAEALTELPGILEKHVAKAGLA